MHRLQMKSNTSNFNVYPHLIFASVVLVDGKIANFKTGDIRWTRRNFLLSTQPRMVLKTHPKEVKIRSKQFRVNNLAEHQKAFKVFADRFFKKFKIHPQYQPYFRPYE